MLELLYKKSCYWEKIVSDFRKFAANDKVNYEIGSRCQFVGAF